MAADYTTALFAAENALAGMALRAVFARARHDEPEVVSLRIEVHPDALPGLDVIECEAVNRDGMAIGGWSL